MSRDELSRVAEIDRHESIEVLYEQRGAQLIERHGRWDAAGWDPDGTGEHSVTAKVRETEQYVDGGGGGGGAFADDRLVGMGIVVPHLRPSVNTVRFYLARGFQPTEHPPIELLQLEPDDIHMHKAL